VSIVRKPAPTLIWILGLFLFFGPPGEGLAELDIK
jgi:hypothetical protein